MNVKNTLVPWQQFTIQTTKVDEFKAFNILKERFPNLAGPRLLIKASNIKENAALEADLIIAKLMH